MVRKKRRSVGGKKGENPDSNSGNLSDISYIKLRR